MKTVCWSSSTPDFQKESSRLCKKYFRKVISLIKRSKDFEDGKRVISEVRNLETSGSHNNCGLRNFQLTI